jgi:hypothetical protein
LAIKNPNPKLSSSLELSSSSIFSSRNLPPRFIAAKKLYSKQILDIGKDTTRKGGGGKKKEEENQASEIYVLFSSSHIFQEQKLYKTTEISLLRSDGGGEGSFFE